jgi:hypothetical protein
MAKLIKRNINIMPDIDNNYEVPPLQITVTTYEFIEDKWVASISHTFHGNDQDTLFRLIEIHKNTDPYFRASFDGIFYHREGATHLKNSEVKVLYP